VKLPIDRRNGFAFNSVILLSILCLFFTFTNIVPFSAGLALLLPFLPIFLFHYKTVHSVFLYLSIMLVYFAVNAFLYDPKQLIMYDFFRRDGNVFITFAPLLILSLIKANIDLDKIVRFFIYWSTLVNFVFIIIFLVTGGTIFFYEPIYHFLFNAHNAAGGFLGFLTALSVGYLFGTRKKRFFLLSGINGFGLYLTDSRGSILGLIVAFIIVIILKDKKTKFLVSSLIIFQVIFLGWFYVKVSPSGFLSNQFFYQEIGLDIERASTIFARVYYLWPRGIYLFLQSPIFGTGFGSYNDTPYNLYGLSHVLKINLTENIRLGDNHAHHTFVNVLAETGIVGFLLLFIFLTKVRTFIKTIKLLPLQKGLLIAFWFNIVSSFTEHRLFTPSQMLPFCIILGLSVAYSRFLNNKNLNKRNEKVA